jgi:hypothetical protein
LDVVGGLERVEGLDISHVAHDVVIEQDSVPGDIPRVGDNLRFSGVIPLGKCGDRVGEPTPPGLGERAGSSTAAWPSPRPASTPACPR